MIIITNGMNAFIHATSYLALRVTELTNTKLVSAMNYYTFHQSPPPRCGFVDVAGITALGQESRGFVKCNWKVLIESADNSLTVVPSNATHAPAHKTIQLRCRRSCVFKAAPLYTAVVTGTYSQCVCGPPSLPLCLSPHCEAKHTFNVRPLPGINHNTV